MDHDTRQAFKAMRQEVAVALSVAGQQRKQEAEVVNGNFAGMHQALGKIILACTAMRDKLIELEVITEDDVPTIGIEIKREVKRGVPSSKLITPGDNAAGAEQK